MVESDPESDQSDQARFPCMGEIVRQNLNTEKTVLPFVNREIDEMIKTVDKNEDGKISYSEFRVSITSAPDPDSTVKKNLIRIKGFPNKKSGTGTNTRLRIHNSSHGWDLFFCSAATIVGMPKSISDQEDAVQK